MNVRFMSAKYRRSSIFQENFYWSKFRQKNTKLVFFGFFDRFYHCIFMEIMLNENHIARNIFMQIPYLAKF